MRKNILSVLISFLILVGLPAVAHPICDKWQPGHYLRTPVMNGNQALVAKQLSRDLNYFKGIVYQFNWRDLETSQGVYNWAALDDALSQVTSKNKYLFLFMMDRSFGCSASSSPIPDYVKLVRSTTKASYCTAAIWEEVTMGQRIRVTNAMLARYRNNPRVLGVFVEETALAIDKTAFSFDAYKTQLLRFMREVHAANPNMIISQELNFPQESQRPGFMSGLVQGLLDLPGGGGGISWPDTDLKDIGTWEHYQFARDNRYKLVIAPMVQSPQILATDTKALYTALVEDIQSHIIVWNHYHQDMANYVDQEVIPTVNSFKGYIKNSRCPFGVASSLAAPRNLKVN